MLAMSSGAAVMSRASAASRDLEMPLNFADGIMIAYKASKSALNQGARCNDAKPSSMNKGPYADLPVAWWWDVPH